MKSLSVLSALAGVMFMGAASAADITVFYSPTCPHCHHARDFISSTLIYEYPTLKVSQVNVMEEANRAMFEEALKKCEYSSGGVPVLVVGEKCFQGYADFMQQDLRDAVSADLTDAEKKEAADNKAALESNPDQFKQDHADRASAISEYNAAMASAEKKTDGGSVIYFYVLLAVLVAGLGIVLIRNKK